MKPQAVTFIHCLDHLPNPETHPGETVFVVSPKSVEYLILVKRYIVHLVEPGHPSGKIMYTIVGWAWAHE